MYIYKRDSPNVSIYSYYFDEFISFVSHATRTPCKFLIAKSKTIVHLLVRNSRRFAIDAETSECTTPKVLVVNVVCHIFQILKMRSYHHIPQCYKIAVLEILNCEIKNCNFYGEHLSMKS